ncbi:hypothetical protein [Sphingomonas kyeonggiensis]|uniref:Uncharacterized protein n=1 Tax=Sphingomonas kyeonggiensis TaxID=1268553 RepID=A0A7W6JQ29_9SPHN|nr:hypothetical protein [Sphingomonas kyeonggiensis]MBB4097485.1 hypothetical protein [Sphingomonas kyeonggiensis]
MPQTPDDETDTEAADQPLDILLDVIATLLPTRDRGWNPVAMRPRRVIDLAENGRLDEDDLALAITALDDLAAERHLDVEVVLKLLGEAERLKHAGTQADAIGTAIKDHVGRHWGRYLPQLSHSALHEHSFRRIFMPFPQLVREDLFINDLARAIASKSIYAGNLLEVLAKVPIDTQSRARLLVDALDAWLRPPHPDTSIVSPLFAAIGRGLIWSPWAVLQAILRARPDYAARLAVFERAPLNADGARAAPYVYELATQIEPRTQERLVAAILLELIVPDWEQQGVLVRPAETRTAYVDRLVEAVGDNAPLRQATIEALLWRAEGRGTDLAHYAATALAQGEDRYTLIELEEHQHRPVQSAARAVRAAKLGDRLSVAPIPASFGLVQSLAALELRGEATAEPARTWLGDRAVEELIETTIRREELRFALEYENHGDEGEDRLLASLFGALAMRFADLDQALDALARATAAPYRASATMRYRNVDRAEEGSKGIKGVKKFSADLCLIVNPVLNGTSLGRRVTLVQAKRLYRDHAAADQPKWHASFRIEKEQVDALLAQTGSSMYFFHGPAFGGRGVPVIPTQLVADLSRHEASGHSLAREVVATASRSLADWLTYDALALRTGDPYAELVEKAEGRPGSLPRRLLELPTVEVELAVTPRSEAR